MLKFKRTIILVLIIIISLNTLILWGQQKKGETITLKMIWWGTQDRVDKTLKVIDMYQKENPNIKIEPIYTSWTGYFEKLATLITANEMPDIAQMTIQNLPQFAEKDLLEDLSNLKSVDFTGIDPGAKESGMYQGKILCVNLGVNAPALFYNQSYFDKAGVKYPNENWTWADLEKAALTLSRKLKMPGIFNFALDYNDFEIYAREKGESLYSKDTKSVGFTENALTDFLVMSLRMQKSGAMEHVKISREVRGNDEGSSYAKGNSAMRFAWSNKVVSIFKSLQKDSILSVYPGPNSKEGMFTKPGTFLCIAKSSKYKEEAGKFLIYFISNVEANKVLNAERGIPVYENVRKALSEKADSQAKIVFDYIGYVSKYSTRPLDPQFPTADRECKSIMQSIFEEVLFEKITPKEGAKKLIKEWNATLSK